MLRRQVRKMGHFGPGLPRWWYLGLGSNIGNRERHLAEAIDRLAALPTTTVNAVSSVYETDPWGDPEQPPFLNLVTRLRTALEPTELLSQVKRIELALGRRPRYRWGPREIDIDLLLAENLVINTPELTVPHPLLYVRQFVLVPLAELDPELLLPDGSTVSSHLTGDGSVRRWAAHSISGRHPTQTLDDVSRS